MNKQSSKKELIGEIAGSVGIAVLGWLMLMYGNAYIPYQPDYQPSMHSEAAYNGGGQ